MSRYANVPELRALARLFGPYALREVGLRVEQPLAQGLASLDALLTAHEKVLRSARDAYQVCGFHPYLLHP